MLKIKSIITNFITGGLIMFSLFGCTQNTPMSAPIAVEPGKAVVVYFSWSSDGNTRFAAETIAAKLGAKTFEIKPEKPYSSDYSTCCDEAKPECTGKQLRPILPIDGLNAAQYDVIFVGTPNWWGTMAPPVRTWITQNASALEGKNVCVFQTNGGGGMQRVGKEFAELVPNSKILPAQAFPGGSIRRNVAALEKFVTDRVSVKKN